MDKAIQTKQYSCKRLAEQTILTTEKCDLWQHGPGIGASIVIDDIRQSFLFACQIARRYSMSKLKKEVKVFMRRGETSFDISLELLIRNAEKHHPTVK